MNNQIKSITETLKQKIIAGYPGVELKLFGSAARGESVPGSDIDVLVRLPVVSSAIEKEIFDLAYEVELEFDCVIDVFVLSTSHTSAIPLIQNVDQEGVEL